MEQDELTAQVIVLVDTELEMMGEGYSTDVLRAIKDIVYGDAAFEDLSDALLPEGVVGNLDYGLTTHRLLTLALECVNWDVVRARLNAEDE